MAILQYFSRSIHHLSTKLQYIPLIRIRSSFFPHVIGCSLAEVQATDGDLCNLISRKIDSAT